MLPQPPTFAGLEFQTVPPRGLQALLSYAPARLRPSGPLLLLCPSGVSCQTPEHGILVRKGPEEAALQGLHINALVPHCPWWSLLVTGGVAVATEGLSVCSSVTAVQVHAATRGQ